MGMERFGALVDHDNFQLRPSHFAPERFAKVEPGDTFYGQERFPTMHMEMDIERKLADPDSLEFVGDKRPALYHAFDKVAEYFPDPKFVFTLREPVAVAASYEGRSKAGKNWPRNRDYKAAVKHWNESIRLTLAAIERGRQIIVTEYRTMFQCDADPRPLLRQLELEDDEAFSSRLHLLRVQARRMRSKPKHELTEEQEAYVREHAAFDEYRELLARDSLATSA